MYKYEHGGDIYTEKTTADGKAFVDFSANINPLGIPVGVRSALRRAVDDCVNYPDPFCRELRSATAKFLGVDEEYIFFGNGAADILFRMALALKPKKALLLAPTFADYEKALRSVGCEIVYYRLLESNDFAVQEDILNYLTDGLDMVIICNPNNPTGQLCDPKILRQLLNRCQMLKIRMLVDECFMDFVEPEKQHSLRGLLANHHQLVILKAFTKTFAIPGVRLGYCLSADYKFHLALHRHGQDWSVSTLAQEAGKAAVEDKEYLENSMKIIATERKYLKRQLSLLGAKVYGSEANYIFFRLAEPKDLVEKLRQQGYIIRSCGNYHNLSGIYYRIAVKSRKHNSGLIKAIKNCLD